VYQCIKCIELKSKPEIILNVKLHKDFRAF